MITTPAIRKRATKILENYQVNAFPVDIEKIAKNEGIRIIKGELPENISGAIDMSDPVSPCILVNSIDGFERQRFSIAHELGHYFLHKPTGLHVDKDFSSIFLRNENSSMALYPIEIEANKFAAHILMPEALLETAIKEILGKLNQISISELIESLKTKFQVSNSAMTYRLKNLGIISSEYEG